MKRSSFLTNISAQEKSKPDERISKKKKIVQEVEEDNRSPMERLADRSSRRSGVKGGRIMFKRRNMTQI
jgi:hypothetical protein